MTRLGWLALLAISLSTPAAATAAEAGRPWQFEVAAPYLWIPEEHGLIGLGSVSVPVDVGFDDIFDLMGKGDLLGGAGHFEAHNRDLHLTLLFDATSRSSVRATRTSATASSSDVTACRSWM